MKTTQFLILALTLFTVSMTYAQPVHDLNLITSIKSENATSVQLNLEGEIETDYWDKDYISIEILVDDNINKYHISNHLAKEDRFKLVSIKDGDHLFVSMPNRRKFVTVNNEPYYDNLSFKLLVPHYTKVTKNIYGGALITMSN